MSVSRQSGDWWTTNSNRDTEHTKNFRAAKPVFEGPNGKGGGKNQLEPHGKPPRGGCEERSRPFTNWGPNCQLSLASGRWWPEYLSVLSQRELDLADCFGIKAAETGIDALHHSLWWNISQNVGRTDVLPRPGITGCITPGGEPFGPHRGRCILGYEKLLLSGIPADKLLIGTETEVQLSDLAGNAMVMPVISAAILAALCTKAYARRLAADPAFQLSQLGTAAAASASAASASAAAATAASASRGPAQAAAAGTKAGKRKAEAAAVGGGGAARGVARSAAASAAASDGGGGGELVAALAVLVELCEAAEATSVLCTCETSGGVSDSGIVRCADCLVTQCRRCGAGRDLRSHERGAPQPHACCAGGTAARAAHASPALFEQRLRRAAPTAIVLAPASAAELAARGAELPQGADSGHEGEFRLSRVLRERGGWALSYCVCDPEAGTPLAELRVTVGQLGAGRGVCALLYSFAPTLRGERGKMPPIARLVLPAAGGPSRPQPQPRWEVRCAPRRCALKLTPLSYTPSYRAEVGLKWHKHEQWASELRVTGEPSVDGVYERVPCRYSAVFGALWRRRGAGPPLWLLVNPTVDRTTNDQLVVCRSPAYRDCDAQLVLEIVPPQKSATSAFHKPAEAKAKAKAKGKAKAPPKKKPKRKKPKDDSDDDDGDDGDEEAAAAEDGGGDDSAEACGEAETPFELLCRLGYGAPAPSGVAKPAGKQKAKAASEAKTVPPPSKRAKAAHKASPGRSPAGDGAVDAEADADADAAAAGVRAGDAGGAGGAAATVAVTARAAVWEPVALQFAVPPDPTSVALEECGCRLSGIPRPTTRRLIELTVGKLGVDAGSAADAGGWHELRVLTASSTVAERRLAEAVAAPLLAFAAHGGLQALAAWQPLERRASEPAWGSDTGCAPPRPAEIWTADGLRTYDVDESNAFEQALRARPSAWDVRLRADGTLRIAARPHVAAHRAAEALVRGRPLEGAAVQVAWLVDTQRSTLSAAPATSFRVPTSRKFDAAAARPAFFKPGKELYERQARPGGLAEAATRVHRGCNPRAPRLQPHAPRLQPLCTTGACARADARDR